MVCALDGQVAYIAGHHTLEEVIYNFKHSVLIIMTSSPIRGGVADSIIAAKSTVVPWMNEALSSKVSGGRFQGLELKVYSIYF